MQRSIHLQMRWKEMKKTLARIVIYINGKRDISIDYKDILIGNIQPLYMFKDISHNGPIGFIQDLSLYDKVLTESQVLGLYSNYISKDSEILRDSIESSLDFG